MSLCFWHKEDNKEKKVIEKQIDFKRIDSLLVINNKTGKEYSFFSENDYGLDWSTNDKVFNIKQVNDIKRDTWQVLAMFTLKQYSIVKIDWVTTPVKYTVIE